MACYCANFYGSINCHNQVSTFGERCKLCVALKSGASMTDGLLSDATNHWSKAPRPEEKRTRHDAPYNKSIRTDSRHRK